MLYRNQPRVRLLPAWFDDKCGNAVIDRINAELARSNRHVTAAVAAGHAPTLPGQDQETQIVDPAPVSRAIEAESL